MYTHRGLSQRDTVPSLCKNAIARSVIVIAQGDKLRSSEGLTCAKRFNQRHDHVAAKRGSEHLSQSSPCRLDCLPNSLVHCLALKYHDPFLWRRNFHSSTRPR